MKKEYSRKLSFLYQPVIHLQSTIKNGDLALYHHNFIISQLVVTANQLTEIDQYFFKDNEVKLFTCIYDLQTGEFLGLRCEVAFIVLRGDERELFLSYGFDTEKGFSVVFIFEVKNT